MQRTLSRTTRSCRILISTVTLSLAAVQATYGQTPQSDDPEGRFVEIDGTALHYLDFGGQGLPVIFTGGSRAADTWKDLAPLFSDHHRVIAVTDRGVPPSGGERGRVTTRGQDMLTLMDSLGFEKAVFVANSNPGVVLVYLGEEHPERVAGLVFLGNAPESDEIYHLHVDDPTDSMYMVERASLALQGEDPDDAGQLDAYGYDPRYARTSEPTIGVPALTFVAAAGTRGMELVNVPVQLAQQLRDGPAIPDSAAHAFFRRLAVDQELQGEVQAAWETLYAPAYLEAERSFYGAFDDSLEIVSIDVPLITGYEYLQSPQLIEPHVRRFLAEVRRVGW